MKKGIFKKGIAIMLSLGILSSCTDKFEEINRDPNNPVEVSTGSLLSNAQKGLVDDIYDEWFSGRQSYVYSQFLAQTAYTEEDRYQLRQPTNNTYWTLIYGDVMDLVEIIRLNTEDEEGGDPNEIAVARILKAWAMQIMTDTYGDIPYFEAFKAELDVSPAYTPQSEIYADLIKELTEASAQIDPSATAFGSADLIYGGDMSKWQKFANSLKMRVAIRMSNVDPNYQTYIDQALNAPGGVFTSNDDNALLRYVGSTPNVDAAPMYDAYYFSNRNDFTLSKQLVDLMKGENDDLNGKVNPFNGLVDPRLSVWVVPKNGVYEGMPYGIPNDLTSAARPITIDILDGGVVAAGNLGVPLMDYAEVCFILSEANGFDQTWYENGVAASLERWGEEGDEVGSLPANYNAQVTTYLAGLPPANAETVLTQKYIALFLNGYEAWAEIRRTGYPLLIVRPGEITYRTAGGVDVPFEPLFETGDDIPARINYPIIEQSLNKVSYDEAVGRMAADDLMSKVWWDQD